MLKREPIATEQPDAIAALQQQVAELQQANAALQDQVAHLTHEVAASREREQTLRTFQALAEQTPDAIAVAALDTTITYANRACKTLLGYGEHLVGMALRATLAPHEHERLDTIKQQLWERGAWQGHLYYQHSDGAVLPTHVSALLIHDAAGQPVALAAIIRDMREQLAHEQALRASEEQLRHLVQHMPVLLVAFDKPSNTVVWNEECERVTGYRADEIVNNPHAMELLCPDPAYRAAIAEETAQRGLNFRDWEWNLTAKDGTIKTITWFNISEHFPIPGWLTWAVGMDVTERKQIENQLRIFQTLVERALDAIGVMALDGTSLYVNPAAQALFGYDEAIAGTPIVNLHAPHEHERFAALLDTIRQQGSWQGLMTMQRQDASTFSAHISAVMIHDDAGHPQVIAVIVRDMTEMLQREEALRQAHDELEARVHCRTADLTRAKQLLEHSVQQLEHAHAELLQSEARSRALLAAMPDSMLLYQRDGTVLDCKDSTAFHLPSATHQIIGSPLRDMLPTTLHHRFAMHTERAFATDSIQVFEYHLPVDDHTCTYEARLVVCAPDQVVAIVRDITRRKQAEAALAESEERYRTLVEISPSAILLTDMDSTIRFCNQQAALLFGYGAVDDLIGLQGTDLLIPEISSEPLLQVQNVIESGNMRNIEYVMCRNDGSHFPAEVSSSLMTDAQGNPTAMVIVVRDTSETRMVEQALTTAYNDVTILNAHLIHRRNLLRAIFDGLEDGLLLLDGEGYVLEVNKALASLFGSTPTALVGENWATIYPRIARNFAGHVALHFPPRERLQRRRTLYHSPDGQTRILNLQIIALSGPDKAAEQVILHVVDVTETVHLQQRLIENERFAASGRLAASVAHEINTPLQSIQTFLELVQIASDADRDTFLQHALEEIQRTGRIVHQLLDLYRPGAAVPGRVAINELIERIVLLIGKSLRDHRIALERDLAADLPLLWGRADALMQVILNLMNNAIDAMPHGGSLRVQTRYHAQHAAIEVAMSDSGNGIAPDLQERIFEAFVTTKEDGLGLGLSISKQILQQHGGDIRVESAAGRGTTFTIVLPLNPGTEPALT